MKKVNVMLAAVFAMGLMAQGAATAQNVAKAEDDLFAGTEVFEKNATDVTEITMDPDSLAMVNGKDKDKAHNTVLQTVRTYEYDKPGMYNMADVDKIRERLETGDWHCSVHERHLKSGESTDICEKRRTDDLFESAIITVEPKELTFIHTISHHPTGMGMPMGDMGMGIGAGAGSSLAMLNPEMLGLRVQLNSLKSGVHLNMLGPDMMVIPDIHIDSEELQRSVDRGMKEWDRSSPKMKEYLSPDGMHKLYIAPDAPEPPAVPEPAPAAEPAPMPQPAAPAEPAPALQPAPRVQ